MEAINVRAITKTPTDVRRLARLSLRSVGDEVPPSGDVTTVICFVCVELDVVESTTVVLEEIALREEVWVAFAPLTNVVPP